jgi:hypothetical protein
MYLEKPEWQVIWNRGSVIWFVSNHFKATLICNLLKGSHWQVSTYVLQIRWNVLVGFLALPGISRREYAWEGGGGGGWRRRWCAVVAGRAAAACYSTLAVLFTRGTVHALQYRAVLFTRTGGGGGRIRVGPWGRQSLIDCQTDYSPNNPKVFITNMKTLTTSTNPTAVDDRRLGRLRH